MTIFIKYKQQYLIPALWLVCSVAFAKDYVVIVHPENTSKLDNSVVERIFLGKQKTFPDGSEAIPLDAAKGSELYSSFLSSFISKSESQLNSYWSMLIFSGKGAPPRTVDDEEEVVNLVSKNPNLIGYISKNSVTDKVKVALNF